MHGAGRQAGPVDDGEGEPVWKLDAAVHGHLVELGVRVFDSAGLPEFFG